MDGLRLGSGPDLKLVNSNFWLNKHDQLINKSVLDSNIFYFIRPSYLHIHLHNSNLQGKWIIIPAVLYNIDVAS